MPERRRHVTVGGRLHTPRKSGSGSRDLVPDPTDVIERVSAHAGVRALDWPSGLLALEPAAPDDVRDDEEHEGAEDDPTDDRSLEERRR